MITDSAVLKVEVIESKPSLLKSDAAGYYMEEVVSGKKILRRLKAKARAAAEMEARRVLQKWREKLRNLWLRGGTWYLVATVHRRRISRSLALEEGDLEEARKKVRKLIAIGREQRWEVLEKILEETSLRKGWATIGKCLEIFEAQGRAHDLRPETARDYRTSLARVLGVEDLEQVSTERLTKEAVRRYVADKLGDVTDCDTASVRRSIVSTVRQARAIFGKAWAMEAYADAGLRLPALDGWRSAFVAKSEPVQYRLPDPERGITWELIRKTDAAGEKLRGEQSALWAVWLLARYLALRAGEIAAARWEWLVQDSAGRWWIEIVKRTYWQPKGSEGKVPVPAAVMGWLNELRTATESEHIYIVPAKKKTARKLMVTKKFAAWMRGLGWTTGKCAHELRKLRGSEWYTKRGLEAACEWLRHADIGTTKRFYAAFTVQPPTLEVGE